MTTTDKGTVTLVLEHILVEAMFQTETGIDN
ncbi:uncharacterized protein FIBRA_09443 [Fibroporia radiculosa]|uniref:Uncharacterized protein n=1 Tax=Fibroporia radiculosa TaxID=599839 RepID=J7SCE7_9APHY|nr:uncharacterized protein FIBRA_09443 [Fibroporia radiculosa]CCM07111.1 predicted protein [Fibroporia radiculosa]